MDDVDVERPAVTSAPRHCGGFALLRKRQVGPPNDTPGADPGGKLRGPVASARTSLFVRHFDHRTCPVTCFAVTGADAVSRLM
jgi:hypothetical protein